MHKEYLEKNLEDGLVKHIQKFLIELGQGFAFVGQQYPLKAGEHDLYIDLLFYHLKLRCYMIVELKAGKFDSRDAGQMSAYFSAVDDQLRHDGDQPSGDYTMPYSWLLGCEVSSLTRFLKDWLVRSFPNQIMLFSQLRENFHKG